jgi:hypothetical protein
MIKTLSNYVEMFKEENRNLQITVQIKEHLLRLYNDEAGFNILFESLGDIPCELLRYSADEDILISLKYWEGKDED